MENLVGQNLDRYQITSLLFEDQSANLFLANDPKLDRLVAIYLNKQQEKQVEKSIQDVRSMVTWRHAGLARLFDVGSYEGRLYFVQEKLSKSKLKSNSTEYEAGRLLAWTGGNGITGQRTMPCSRLRPSKRKNSWKYLPRKYSVQN